MAVACEVFLEITDGVVYVLEEVGVAVGGEYDVVLVAEAGFKKAEAAAVF